MLSKPLVTFVLSSHVSARLPQAEQASLSHILELLSLILLSAIWALCPRDSLALLGQWVQDKLSQVRSGVLLAFSHFIYSIQCFENRECSCGALNVAIVKVVLMSSFLVSPSANFQSSLQ